MSDFLGLTQSQLKKLLKNSLIGGRKAKRHQWFTPDFVHPKLKEHLAAVIASMRAAPNRDAFTRYLNCVFPKSD